MSKAGTLEREEDASRRGGMRRLAEVRRNSYRSNGTVRGRDETVGGGGMRQLEEGRGVYRRVAAPDGVPGLWL